MNNIPYADKLRSLLHSLFPDAKDVSGNTEITINCPLCAQEGNPDKGHHMYISLGLNGKPPMFNCFRHTGHSGLLTKQALELFTRNSEGVNPRIFDEIEKYNTAAYISREVSSIKKAKLSINNNVENSNSIFNKISYISKRIGVDLSYQDIIDNKIILSLYDFLNFNQIKELTMNKYVTDTLDRYFIGFLTNTNTTLIMRNTTDTNPNTKNKILSMRYMKYKVFPNATDTSYYFVPSVCNTYEPIDIYIAEGPFDILSIFYNLQHCDRRNKIYASIGSKAYINLMEYFFTHLGLINVRFHIYMDSGVEKSILNEIARKVKPIGIDIQIHINTYTGEKDFGVPLDRISDYTYKL